MKNINEFLEMTVEEVFAQRFSRYSKYIIQDRALPDVRDGLKPVQRRIIYSMNKEGNTFNKPFRKSAKTVGNVIGNYHPHGDTSVYDAMVRMSQYWKNNELLVLMHGNNGSIDGDSAAAMRYTEAKLSKYAELMVQNIYEDTVDTAPNFDDTEMEPVVLPSLIPNLLVNGTTGISSGYATDIPPHNLTEVLKASIHLNKNRNANVEDIMKFIKGPDFPTGAIVQGIEGIKDAYTKGKGKIVIQSKYEIVDNQIIIKEIPYDVNKSNLLQKLDLIRINKKIDGIEEVIDQSDQLGLEISIVCKKQTDKQLIINYLLKNTDLQKNYNFNMIAINNRKPELMGILDILIAFLEHREDVILRRSKFRLDKTNKKLHIIEGLIKAVLDLDNVIKIIKKSKNKEESKLNLIKAYKFSNEQAESVVMMQLYKLSNTDVTNLEDTFKELSLEKQMLEDLINNHDLIINEIENELNTVLENNLVNRKSKIETDVNVIEINSKDLIKSEETIISISKLGYIKRSSNKSYLTSIKLSNVINNDKVVDVIRANTKDNLIVLLNNGTYLIIPVYDIEDMKWKETGKHLSSFCKLDDGVFVVKAFIYKEGINSILSVTEKGYLSRVKLEDFNSVKIKQKIQYQKLKKDDFVSFLDIDRRVDFNDILNNNVIIITNMGNFIQLPLDDVETNNIKRVGNKVIKLKKNEVVNAIFKFDNDIVLYTNKNGYLKFAPDQIENSNKSILLYQNFNSNKHEVIKYLKVTSDEFLRIGVDDSEEIMRFKDLKYCDEGEKLKVFKKSQESINIEVLV